MADKGHQHIPKGIEEHRPVRADDVPDEEGVAPAEVAEGLERDPDEQLNRPDQADATPAEKAQYDDPPLTAPLSDEDPPTDGIREDR